ncbi:MAG TPA: HEAT repeat domain-containing protein [Cyclobacteriaceae bacterium]|nr:HEAT repeat domain-containing protein [Cyclobacteriaceae bacterium]
MNKIEELIAKYNEGLADPAEIRTLEGLIEKGVIELTRLHELSRLDEQIVKIETPSPSLELDSKFQSMLAAEKKKLNRGMLPSLPDLSILWPRLAFAASLVLVGFVGGYWLQHPSANPEVTQLTNEVSELKEMMMISLLEKESATERLRAVSLTSNMDRVSIKVTDALFQTLNHDSNVNVRLAALEALTGYTAQSEVREGLIRSIAFQDSPLVQLNLAELMVALQERKSVSELQKLLDNDNTPKEVKTKLKKSIEVLI